MLETFTEFYFLLHFSFHAQAAGLLAVLKHVVVVLKAGKCITKTYFYKYFKKLGTSELSSQNPCPSQCGHHSLTSDPSVQRHCPPVQVNSQSSIVSA